MIIKNKAGGRLDNVTAMIQIKTICGCIKRQELTKVGAGYESGLNGVCNENRIALSTYNGVSHGTSSGWMRRRVFNDNTNHADKYGSGS